MHQNWLRSPRSSGEPSTNISVTIDLFRRADSLIAALQGCPALSHGWSFALAAELTFAKAMDGCPGRRAAARTEALRGVGEAHLLAGDSTAALTALREAVRTGSPRHMPIATARSHIVLGLVHRLLERPDSALVHFERARAVLVEAEQRYVGRDPALVKELERWTSWWHEVLERIVDSAVRANVISADEFDADAVAAFALSRARAGAPIPIPDPPGGRNDSSLDRLRALLDSDELRWMDGVFVLPEVLRVRLATMRHLAALHRAEGRDAQAFALVRAIERELEMDAAAVGVIAADLQHVREFGQVPEGSEVNVEMVLDVDLGPSFEDKWGHFACLPAAGLPPCGADSEDAIVELERGIRRDRWLGRFEAELAALQRLRARYAALGRVDSATIYQKRARPLAAGLAPVSVRGAPGTTEAPSAERLNLARAAGALWDSLYSFEKDRFVRWDEWESKRNAVARLDSLASTLDPEIDLAAEDPAVRAVAELRLLIAVARAHRRAEDFDEALYFFEHAWDHVPIGPYRLELSDETSIALAEQTADLYGEWALAWLAWGDAGAAARADTAAAAALLAVDCGRARTLGQLMDYYRDPHSCSRMVAAKPWTRYIPAPYRVGDDSLDFAFLLPSQANVIHEATADTLLVWLRRTGELRVERVPVPRDSLARWVQTVRRGVVAGPSRENSLRSLDPSTRGLKGVRPVDAENFARARSRLWEALFPPSIAGLLPDSGEVVVSPGGFLNELPYAVLAPDSVQLPLGLRLALRFTPASWLHSAILARDPQTSTLWEVRNPGSDSTLPTPEIWLARGLVLGDPALPSRLPWAGEVDFPPLPGAAAEADQVGARLGVAPLKGEEATEAAVRSRLPDASIVHLATHGFAYSAPHLADRSFVALTEGSGHDGFLTVGELIAESDLQLTADLVVLSACQTALGHTTQSEGTVGLQRALLGRGARSLLVSLWNVSDAATALLMDRFYEEWLTERLFAPGKAEALRRAMAAVRATPGFEHPRHWAAFQLIGAD